jgi:hypothetical protein
LKKDFRIYRLLNHLYKMKYNRPAPKCGRCSYPAAAGCSLQSSTGPFACRSRGCSARFAPGVANETANPSATGEVYFNWLRYLHSAGHRSLQIRKQAAQSGRRSSAQRLLCPLCAGEPENAKQPGFYVDPK